MSLFWLARKWFWTSAIGSNSLFILEYKLFYSGFSLWQLWLVYVDFCHATTTRRCPGPLEGHYTLSTTSPLLVHSLLLSLGSLSLAWLVPLLRLPSTQIYLTSCIRESRGDQGAWPLPDIVLSLHDFCRLRSLPFLLLSSLWKTTSTDGPT
jgi:hypothetical protein